MPNNEIPFYAQTAILDRYLHRANATISPEIVDSIVGLLQENSELRAYFFRNKPHHEWAHVLWVKGFFAAPPTPVLTENGNTLPRWDVQDYLISVAEQVPDLVVKHAETVDGEGWYISQALRALTSIPVSFSKAAFPKLMQLLDKPSTDRMISEYVYEIMISFAKNELPDLAFALFESMTEPVMLTDKARLAQVLYKDEANSKSEAMFADWKRDNVEGLFANLDIVKTIMILDKNLRKALVLEEKNLEDPYYRKASGWRSSIEDTDQNHFLSYKEKILQKLRVVIEGQFENQGQFIRSMTQEYIFDEMNIFRRLGIHFVREYPSVFPAELNELLGEYENLDNYSIHHEFFLLLRDGFAYLEKGRQEELILKILSGPPKKTIDDYGKLWKEGLSPASLDVDSYVNLNVKDWVFKRLWMIRDYLSGTSRDVFNNLLEEIGEPGFPPEFTSYMTSFSRIEDVSPLTINEIRDFSPPELISFLSDWKPEANRSRWPNEHSYSSLGNEVAKVIFENPNRYRDYLFEIALIKPAYGNAIVSEFSKLDQRSEELWYLILQMCEKLLELEEVRSVNISSADDSWRYFKYSLLELVKSSFTDEQKNIPDELFLTIKQILLVLINDPDPSVERDRLSDDQSSSSEPSHIALNSIRPTALNALITSAMEEYKANNKNYSQELGPKRLSFEIKSALDIKLDVSKESSLAMRSVFGERLVNLFWLDKEWTENSLEKIFPLGEDEESKWLFASAASSYVIFRNFFVELYDVLFPVYDRTINLFSKGYFWKTHLQPVTHLAAHILWAYLETENSTEFSSVDQNNLIAKFFLAFNAEGRKDGAFICRRIMDVPENVEKYWYKLKKIWEWRSNIAVQADNTNDFSEEILQFVQLVSVAPESETVQSLWPMLVAAVPHFQGMQFRDMGWEAIEDFLAKKVDNDPLKSIELYTMMYKRASPPRWLEKRDAARIIIETAVKDDRSKQAASDLINFIGGRLGDDRFRDLYEKYC